MIDTDAYALLTQQRAERVGTHLLSDDESFLQTQNEGDIVLDQKNHPIITDKLRVTGNVGNSISAEIQASPTAFLGQ